MDVMHAFDNVTPFNLIETMRNMGVHATLTETALRIQIARQI